MKNIISKIFLYLFAVLAIGVVGTGCNKDLPEAQPIVPAPVTGTALADLLNDPSFSILKAAVTRAGLLNTLTAENTSYTLFAPDDAAFQLSGIPSAAVIAALPEATLKSILQYHVIGGQRLTSADFSDKFSNNYLQSSLLLQAPSAALPTGYRMPIFVSRRGTQLWVNNIPVKQADVAMANGVLHKVAALISPPQQTLWSYIDTASNFKYLRAAVKKADVGSAPVVGQSLQTTLDFPLANLTVLAPTDAAFQQTLYGLVYPRVYPLVYQQMYTTVYNNAKALGATDAQAAQAAKGYADANAPTVANTQVMGIISTPDVFDNPALASVLTVQTVKGIVSYHVLGTRVFSVNLPTGESSYPSIAGALLPNISANRTTSGVEVRGPGMVVTLPDGTKVNYWGKVTKADVHFVNGAVHVIDKVLLPLTL